MTPEEQAKVALEHLRQFQTGEYRVPQGLLGEDEPRPEWISDNGYNGAEENP